MRGPVFEDARTPKGFARVEADSETGTIVWPGGADLAPDTLYERVRSGAWPSPARPSDYWRFHAKSGDVAACDSLQGPPMLP